MTTLAKPAVRTPAQRSAVAVALGMLATAWGALDGDNPAAQLAAARTALATITATLTAIETSLVVPKPSLSFGCNLTDGHRFRAGQAHLWIDRTKAADPWYASVWNAPDITPDLDARGYPTSIPPTAHMVGFLYPVDGAETRYVICTNKPDIAVPGMTLSPDGFTVFTPTVEGGEYSSLNLSAIGSPFKPTEYLAIVRYDHLALWKAGAIYDPDVKAKLNRFKAFRFMDWLHTNGSPFASFADMPPADTFNYNTAVPVAVCRKVANDFGVDAHMPVPHQFDDASVDLYAATIRDSLKGHLSAPLSNEVVWNGVYPFGIQGAYFGQMAQTEAFKEKFPNGADGLTAYGYRSAQVAQRMVKAFAGQRSRLTTVIGCQSVVPDLQNRKAGAMKAGQELGLTPKVMGDLIDAIEITWYFGLPSENDADRAQIVAWAKGGDAGLNAAFDALQTGKGLTTNVVYASIASLTKLFGQWGALAAAEHMKILGYEGGHAMPLTGYTAEQHPYAADLRHRMRAHQRMADCYGMMADAMAANGFITSFQFADFGSEQSDGGDWLLYPSATSPETPMTRKLASLNGVMV